MTNLSRYRTVKIGIFSGFTSQGLGVLIDQVNLSPLVFTLNKVPGYQGEPISDFNIKRGDEVIYDTDNEGAVIEVRLRIRGSFPACEKTATALQMENRMRTLQHLVHAALVLGIVGFGLVIYAIALA